MGLPPRGMEYGRPSPRAGDLSAPARARGLEPAPRSRADDDPELWLEGVALPSPSELDDEFEDELEDEPCLSDLDDDAALFAVELDFDEELWREASARHSERLSERLISDRLSSERLVGGHHLERPPRESEPTAETCRIERPASRRPGGDLRDTAEGARVGAPTQRAEAEGEASAHSGRASRRSERASAPRGAGPRGRTERIPPEEPDQDATTAESAQDQLGARRAARPERWGGAVRGSGRGSEGHEAHEWPSRRVAAERGTSTLRARSGREDAAARDAALRDSAERGTSARARSGREDAAPRDAALRDSAERGTSARARSGREDAAPRDAALRDSAERGTSARTRSGREDAAARDAALRDSAERGTSARARSGREDAASRDSAGRERTRRLSRDTRRLGWASSGETQRLPRESERGRARTRPLSSPVAQSPDTPSPVAPSGSDASARDSAPELARAHTQRIAAPLALAPSERVRPASGPRPRASQRAVESDEGWPRPRTRGLGPEVAVLGLLLLGLGGAAIAAITGGPIKGGAGAARVAVAAPQRATTAAAVRGAEPAPEAHADHAAHGPHAAQPEAHAAARDQAPAPTPAHEAVQPCPWPDRGAGQLAAAARLDRARRGERADASSAQGDEAVRRRAAREVALHEAGGVLVELPLACGERGRAGLCVLDLLLDEGAAPRALSVDLRLPAGVRVTGAQPGDAPREAGHALRITPLGEGPGGEVLVRLESRGPRALAPGRLAVLSFSVPDPFPARSAVSLESLRLDGGAPRPLSLSSTLVVE
ncbi:MAG: hypothetical protein AB7N76_09360 [Planctomycetota bacterium]